MSESLNPDDFFLQLNQKITKFFKEKIFIHSREDLDSFLSAIDLLDIWNSIEEKNMVWKYLQSQKKDGKIDVNGAICAIKNLINQDDEPESPIDPYNKLIKKIACVKKFKDKLTSLVEKNNKNKQKAIEEYECLDNGSLIQLKMIFYILKIDNKNLNIDFKQIKDICSNHKNIKISIEDACKYISLLSTNEQLSIINKKIKINYDIFETVNKLINEKLSDEYSDLDEEDLEDLIDDDKDENNPTELIYNFIKKQDSLQEKALNLESINNSLKKYKDKIFEGDFISKNNENIDDINTINNLMEQKLIDFQKYTKKLEKLYKVNNSKLNIILESVQKIILDKKTIEEDYNKLYEKFVKNNNFEVNDEMKKVVNENMLLIKDNESKKETINKLKNEKHDLSNEIEKNQNKINELLSQIKEKEKESNELKLKYKKQKEEYDILVDEFLKVSNSKKENQTRKMSKSEKTLKEEISDFLKINELEIPEKEKINKKKEFLQDFDNEKLKNFIIELDRINQNLLNENNLHEKNQKENEIKINELKQCIIDKSEELRIIKTEKEKLIKKNTDFNISKQENNSFRTTKTISQKLYSDSLQTAQNILSKLEENSNQLEKIEKEEEKKDEDKSFGFKRVNRIGNNEVESNLTQKKSSLQRKNMQSLNDVLLEARNKNNDYYSLFLQEYIQKELRKLGDFCGENQILSDAVYVVNEKKKVNKNYLLITPTNILIIDPKDEEILFVINKNNIKNIVITNKNINIILFRCKTGQDLLIITLRRMDILYFIKNNFNSENEKNVTFKFADQFVIIIKNVLTVLTADDNILMPYSQFEGALKVGYLLEYKGKFIKRVFYERLAVLTPIGLFLLTDPQDKGKNICPIIGSKITVVDKEKYGRNNCFEVTLYNGEVRVFGALKLQERKSWIELFENVQNDYDKYLNNLTDIFNKDFIEKTGELKRSDEVK